MRYEWKGSSLLIVHNFRSHPEQAEIAVQEGDPERLSNLHEEEEVTAEDGVYRIDLQAVGYRWFRIGGLNYAVRRERR